MKKIAITIIIVGVAGAVFYHWERFKAYTFHRLPEIKESIQNSEFLSDIRREVFTSGPLRSADNYVNGSLSVSGVLEWTNTNRLNNGEKSLVLSEQLNAAAQAKVNDMFKNQYFEHVSPSGKGPADLAEAAGYDYVAVGENLALGNFRNDEKLLEAWMNSPGHRANIVSPKYTEIGIAVGKGTFEGRTVWLAVQEFGKPLSACPSLDGQLKATIESYKNELSSLESHIATAKAQLENSEPQTREEYEAYNRDVEAYNSLVKSYNNKVDLIKQLTADYNARVRAFNECVEK